MQNKDQIAELFKETFENYEAPVRSGLWEQVASRIETVTPSVPDGSVATQVVTGASKISGSLMTWIGGAVLVASVGTGIYFLQKETTQPVNANTQVQAIEENNPAPVATETVINYPDENVSQNQNQTGASASPNQNKIVEGNAPVKQNLQTTPANQEAIDNSVPNQNSISQQGSEPVALQPTNNSFPTTSAPQQVVANNNNVSNTGTAVTDIEPVKAVINAQPASGKAPLQVNFSTPPTGATAEWLFGDGSENLRGNNVQHTFTVPGTYRVTLKTTDENGISHEEIKKIEVLADLSISATNIFTPNGDGLNDEFSVKAAEGVDIKVIIFDSSGKLVYKYTGVENSWNGKINNSVDAEAGTYFYVIFATGQNGAVNTHQGTLKLQRN